MSRFITWVKEQYYRVKKWVKEKWSSIDVEDTIGEVNTILEEYGLRMVVEAERSEADRGSEATDKESGQAYANAMFTPMDITPEVEQALVDLLGDSFAAEEEQLFDDSPHSKP